LGVAAPTRKSLVFFWIALFILSIALQYTQFSTPSPVKAASGLLADTVQGFEIDGDLKAGSAAVRYLEGATTVAVAGIGRDRAVLRAAVTLENAGGAS